MDKSLIRQAILDALQNELDVITRAAQGSKEQATSVESRPESQYDTHGQEAAYLAESQAKLAAELQENLTAYKGIPIPVFQLERPADTGALVGLESRGRVTWYFLGPRRGGLEVTVGNEVVTVVTPQSPLGRQLHGSRVGASVQLPGRSGAPQPHHVQTIL